MDSWDGYSHPATIFRLLSAFGVTQREAAVRRLTSLKYKPGVVVVAAGVVVVAAGVVVVATGVVEVAPGVVVVAAGVVVVGAAHRRCCGERLDQVQQSLSSCVKRFCCRRNIVFI